MKKAILHQYLNGNMHEILPRWRSRLIQNARDTGLHVSAVATQALVEIYADLNRVISGYSLQELALMTQEKVFLGANSAILKFPILVELFSSLEDVILDRFMMDNSSIEPCWRRVAFEELSGILHLILERESEPFCACCLGELGNVRERLHDRSVVEVANILNSSTAVTSTEVETPVRFTANQGVTVASIRLVTLLRQARSKILERWIGEANRDESYQHNDREEKAIRRLFDALIDGALGMEVQCVELQEGFSDNAIRVLRLCHIGEEVIALTIAECIDLPYVSAFTLRAELNRIFHKLVRLSSVQNCAKCRTKIGENKNVFLSAERTMKDLRARSEVLCLNLPASFSVTLSGTMEHQRELCDS